MGGWREVLKKQQDRLGYIFNKSDHTLLMNPLSRLVSVQHLWQHKQKLNIKQNRDCETAVKLWELFYLFFFFLSEL